MVAPVHSSLPKREGGGGAWREVTRLAQRWVVGGLWFAVSAAACGGGAPPLGAGAEAADGPSADGGTSEAQAGERSAGSSGEGPAVGVGGAAPAEQTSAGAPAPVLAVRALPSRLDPLDDVDPVGRPIVEDLLFEGLLDRDGAGPPWTQPALADRCETFGDGAPRVAYCHLRADATFHDGSPVSPEDVVYSLSYWMDPRRAWMKLRMGVDGLDKVEIADALPSGGERDPGRWIRIAFATGDPLMLEKIATLKVVPRRLHRGRESDFAKRPIGSGPMRIEQWTESDITFARAAGPREGRRRAAAEHLVVRAMADAAEALAELRRGDVHLLMEVAPVHLPGELGKPGMAPRFRAFLLSPPRFDVIFYNCAAGATSALTMRDALHAAIAKERLVTKVYGRAGSDVDAPVDLHDPIELPLVDFTDARPEDAGVLGLPVPPDPAADTAGHARAAAALDAMGWKADRGVRRKVNNNLRIGLVWDGAEGKPSAVAAAIREDWRALGIQAPFVTAAWGYLLNIVREGKYEALLATLGSTSDADLYAYFHTRGALNVAGIADSTLVAALVEVRSATSASARRAARERVATRLAELRVVTVLHAPAQVALVSRRIRGLEFVDDFPRLDRLAVDPAPTAGW
jgi:ABC-type transport system substrate-binding protein